MEDDGTISIDAGLIENLEYSIDNGVTWQSSTEFSALSSGGYTILIRSTEFTTCTLEREAFLNAVDGPILNEIESIDIRSCIIDNGSILIDAMGTDLEYSIDGGNTWQTTNEFNNLPSGLYQISVREIMSDCIIGAEAIIKDIIHTEIVNVNTLDISDCNSEDGQIEIIAIGESLEYSVDYGMSWSTQNIFENLPSGDYYIIVQSSIAEGCEVESFITLSAPDMPEIINVDFQNPTACNPELGKIEIDAIGDNLEYSFDGGATWQNTNVIVEVMAGNYNLLVRDAQKVQCFVEDDITIYEEIERLEESSFIITPPTDCDLSDGIIEILNNESGLEFSIDGGLIWQNENIFENLPPGPYGIISRIIVLPGCFVDQSIAISEVDCDCGELGIDYSVNNIPCGEEENASINIISVQGAEGSDFEIKWYNGTNGTTISQIGEGWHGYTIIYDNNCLWEDSIYVDMLIPISFELIVQDVSCSDQNHGKIEIVNVTGGSSTYQYSLDDISYQSEHIFSELSEGIYSVFVIDDSNCKAMQTIEILSPEMIEIHLPNLQVISIGESLVLNPLIDESKIDRFSWSPEVGILNPNELVIEVSPQKTTVYTLEVFYADCYEVKEITIEVEETKIGLFFGNIFSPNGDGINDFFYIQGSLNQQIVLHDISVLDRWGNKMFYRSNPQVNQISQGWDGYMNGNIVNPGIYVYILNYSENKVAKQLFGMVTLIN